MTQGCSSGRSTPWNNAYQMHDRRHVKVSNHRVRFLRTQLSKNAKNHNAKLHFFFSRFTVHYVHFFILFLIFAIIFPFLHLSPHYFQFFAILSSSFHDTISSLFISNQYYFSITFKENFEEKRKPSYCSLLSCTFSHCTHNATIIDTF